MYLKNNRVANILLVSLLVLITAASQTLPAKSEEVVGQQAASRELLLKTQNDITVEITSAKVINTGAELGICYTTPDNGEWRPMPGQLLYGAYEVYPDEIEFLEGESMADGKNPGTRCALIRYRIADLSTLAAPVKFSILQFYAPGREMYTPCEELQQRLNTSPKAQAYGLKAGCTLSSDGNVSVMLVEHDPSVTETEAGKTLDQIAKAEVDGPWEFTIKELER
jgi:hypothetical protein